MSESPQEIARIKREYERLKAIQEFKEKLPHLYCFPFYQWQREFWDNTSAFQFLFAANQIGKSSVMIRRMIHYCTEPKLWKQFKRRPRLTFYLYPDKHTIKREIETKWPEFLPDASLKNHPQYGYKIKYDGGYPSQIEWNTGVVTVLRSYGGGATKETAHRLQASTPAIVACDEELPLDLWPELQMRIASPANAGAMFWMACTPTRGQKYLRDIQSGKTKMPNALVKTVSMYDCLVYEDGKPGLWTREKIKQIEQTLPTQKEIEVRVHGLFKATEGLALPSFDELRNVKPYHPVPQSWDYYCGLDYGIGGQAHPPAIVIVAVSPTFDQARVVRTWKGDDGATYTVDDVLNKYLELSESLGFKEIPNTYYDWGCGEMAVIANRRGLAINRANKDRKHGFNTLNSLFKNAMLIIYERKEGEETYWSEKLVDEIEGYQSDSKEFDDLIDALRYAIGTIIFNFENIVVPQEEVKIHTRRNRRETYEEIEVELTLEDEIEEWNSYYNYDNDPF